MTTLFNAYWCPTNKGDVALRSLYLRHYSSGGRSAGADPLQFVGPGESLCLITADNRAGFVWRKFINDDRRFGTGVNCALFRNERGVRGESSRMIREADEIAWKRWPGERLYTYIDPKKIRSTNPGYCFVAAGWRLCGTAKSGKLVFEHLPAIAESEAA